MKRSCVWIIMAISCLLLPGQNSLPGSPPPPTERVASGLDTLVLAVQGMVCSGCEMAVESVLSKLSGVHSVIASHEKGEVRVAVDREKSPSLAALAEAVTKSGYSASVPKGASSPAPLVGQWKAIVSTEDVEEHEVIVDLGMLGSRWVGEFDIPSFGVENYSVDIAVSDTAVDLHFSAMAVDFHGRFSSDEDSLIGMAHRRDGEGEDFEVVLHRTGETSFSEMFLTLEAAAEDSTAVRVLSGLAELKASFNRDIDKVRLLMLLAPS